MASLFDSLQVLLTDDLFAQAGERLGIPGAQVRRGLEIATPLMTRGAARLAETPEGQVALAELVKGADTSLLGNLRGFLGTVTPESGDAMLTRLFGPEARVVRAEIQEATGLDISPILGMAGPLLLGFLGNTMQREQLDTNGLVKKLRQEARAFDRQKGETAVLVDSALSKADEARALRTRFSSTEWPAVRSGPLAAAAAVVAASPSKAARVEQEAAAARAAVRETTQAAPSTSLLAALFHPSLDDLSVNGIDNPMAAVEQAAALVKRHAPDEAEGYNRVLLAAASAAAGAVKEGGFIGLGAREVSREEQRTLDALAAALVQ